MTTPTTAIAPSRYPICRHIKTNGRRCQSPAVHRNTFCHFHRTLHDAHTKGFPPPNALGFMPVQHIEKMLSYGEPLAELAKAFPCPTRMALPPLEDAESVQVAISLIFSDMASGHLDHERARPLLYALQLASYNFRTLAQIQTAQAKGACTADPMAHRLVRSRHGQTLAAPNDDSDLGLGAPSSATASSSPKVGSNPTPLPALGAPSSATASSSPKVGSNPRRRRIARPDTAELHRLASLAGPAVAATLHAPDQSTLENQEDESTSGKSTQPHRSPWPGYVCDHDVANRSQSRPGSPQSARDPSIPASFTPCEDPEMPASSLQPQPYDDFSRNSNGMTILASASAPKPNPPLHLRPALPLRGEGGAQLRRRDPQTHRCTSAQQNAPSVAVTSQLSPERCRPALTSSQRQGPAHLPRNPPKDVVFSK